MSKSKKIILDNSFNLPTTRWGYLGWTWKTNKIFLMRLSLLMSLFFIPAIVWIVVNTILEGSIIATYSENAEVMWMQLLALRRMTCWLLIPLSMIFSLGLSGALHIMKRYMWNQGFFLTTDFFIGIKRNFKNGLLYSFIYSVLIAILLFVMNMFSRPEQIFIYIALLVVFSFFIVILLIMWFYSSIISETYINTVFGTIKASFKMAHVDLLKNLFGVLISIGLFLLCILFDSLFFVGYSYLTYIVLTIYVIIGFSHSVLVMSAKAFDTFDKHVNKIYYPDYYRLGLYNEKDEDEDEESYR